MADEAWTCKLDQLFYSRWPIQVLGIVQIVIWVNYHSKVFWNDAYLTGLLLKWTSGWKKFEFFSLKVFSWACLLSSRFNFIEFPIGMSTHIFFKRHCSDDLWKH